MIIPSVRLRPKSSFGVRLQGDFGDAKEVLGRDGALRAGRFFPHAADSSFEFENLALKVNRLNLGSPDLREDWRVLKLQTMGTRAPAAAGVASEDR